VSAVTAPGGTYNVVDDDPVTSERLATALADALGVRRPAKIPAILARLAAGKAVNLLTVSHRVSNDAFKEATGWQPTYRSITEGWQAVVDQSD
jgi:NAD dependent epimerase/dehydratase family enzyme